MQDSKSTGEMANRTPIHVIGYPKSGTTWVTRLLGDALNSPTGSGVCRHNAEPATEGWDRPGPYFILKSHFSQVDRPAELTEQTKVLYVVRDYRDILVSSFFHAHRIDEDFVAPDPPVGKSRLRWFFWRKIVFAIDMPYHLRHGTPLLHGNSVWNIIFYIFRGGWLLFAIYDTRVGAIAERFNRHILRIGRLQVIRQGKWEDHVRYWGGYSDAVAVVQYEDLLMDPLNTLRTAFTRLKVAFDEHRVRGAIDRQSFQRRKSTFATEGNASKAQFLRKGTRGDYRRFLPANILTQAEDKLHAVRHIVDYL